MPFCRYAFNINRWRCGISWCGLKCRLIWCGGQRWHCTWFGLAWAFSRIRNSRSCTDIHFRTIFTNKQIGTTFLVRIMQIVVTHGWLRPTCRVIVGVCTCLKVSGRVPIFVQKMIRQRYLVYSRKDTRRYLRERVNSPHLVFANSGLRVTLIYKWTWLSIEKFRTTFFGRIMHKIIICRWYIPVRWVV